MSQFPPIENDPYRAPMSPMNSSDPTEGNGLAVASLVCGLLFCIPGVTSLSAVILGILGIRKASDPRVRGKGMAIAGVVLGLAGIGLWVAMGFFIYLGFGVYRQMSELPSAFLRDVSKGEINAALTHTSPEVDRAKIEKTVEEVKPWGTFVAFTMDPRNPPKQVGPTMLSVAGTARFEKETKSCTFSLSTTGGTIFKISDWSFR